MNATRPNLIPAYRIDARRFRRRLRYWTAACVVYVGAAAGVYVVCQANAPQTADGASLQEEIADISRQCDVEKAGVAALEMKLAVAGRKLQFNRAIAAQPDWSLLLAVLSGQLGEHAFLRSCVLKPSEGDKTPAPAADHRTAAQRDYIVALKGYGRDHAAVSQYVLRIEKLHVFNEVRVVRTFREPIMSGNAVAFHIECALNREDAVTP